MSIRRVPLLSPSLPSFAARGVALLLALLLLGCLAVPAQAQRMPLRIAYPDFWPFYSIDPGAERLGFFRDIIEEALVRRMQIPVHWECFPWGRCQAKVRAGEFDALITVPTPERLAYTLTHKTSFYWKSLNVFTYAGHPRLEEIKALQTLDDLREADLSVITYLGNGWNDRNVRSLGIPVFETPLINNVWLMLANQRGDIVIEWPGGAWPNIRREGLESVILETDVVFESMPFHLLINKDSPYAEILPRFDEVVREMLEDGSIERIVRSYQ
jgi:polar amino acid transport system substrate-binding protein